jgi:hypothetical protein
MPLIDFGTDLAYFQCRGFTAEVIAFEMAAWKSVGDTT